LPRQCVQGLDMGMQVYPTQTLFPMNAKGAGTLCTHEQSATTTANCLRPLSLEAMSDRSQISASHQNTSIFIIEN